MWNPVWQNPQWGDRMDMKINETTPVSQVEATAPKEKVDGAFKVTLTSKIEESELQEKLNGLMKEID